MACEFCATARMGLHRNLTVGEILSQVFLARKELASDEHLTNYVFMGMGEPLANYPRLLKALTIMTSERGMAVRWLLRLFERTEAMKTLASG